MDTAAQTGLALLLELERKAVRDEIHQRGVSGLTAARLRLESALDHGELDRATALEALRDIEETALRLREIMVRLSDGLPASVVEEALVRAGAALEPLPQPTLTPGEAVRLVAERLGGP